MESNIITAQQMRCFFVCLFRAAITTTFHSRAVGCKGFVRLCATKFQAQYDCLNLGVIVANVWVLTFQECSVQDAHTCKNT